MVVDAAGGKLVLEELNEPCLYIQRPSRAQFTYTVHRIFCLTATSRVLQSLQRAIVASNSWMARRKSLLELVAEAFTVNGFALLSMFLTTAHTD